MKSGDDNPVVLYGQSNFVNQVNLPNPTGEADTPDPNRNYMEDLDNLTKEIKEKMQAESTPVIEQKEDVKQATDFEKNAVVTGFIELTSKHALMLMQMLGLKTHIIGRVVEPSTNEAYIFSFKKELEPESKLLTPDGWISVKERLPDVLDIRIKLIDGSELNVWTQSDGDYWSEAIYKFIPPEKVTHWMPLPKSPTE